MQALIVIDYTVDFVAQDGKLTCGEPGQAIEEKIAQLIREFHERGDLIVFANDLHIENDPYHPETKLFPAHNIKGTEGRNLYGSIQSIFESIQNSSNVKYFDKMRYSAFEGTPLNQYLTERSIKNITLTGVCTDICVLHTAVDAYNKGYEITVFEDAVASFNEAGHAWALQHFKGCLGATII